MVGILELLLLFFCSLVHILSHTCTGTYSNAAGAQLQFTHCHFIFFPCCSCSWLRRYLSSALFVFLIANDVTGNPASQAYTVRDKGIIFLSLLGMFALFIPSARGHLMSGMWPFGTYKDSSVAGRSRVLLPMRRWRHLDNNPKKKKGFRILTNENIKSA